MFRLLASSTLVATLLATPLLAQDMPADETPPGHDKEHHDHSGDIVVTGLRRSVGDTLGGVSILDGADLAARMRLSIGETLASQPGVSATSFGPTASRPILRGLGGDRILLLTDGIGSLDLSSSSADHAVAINPLTADRVEILRGPSALLFGSSAIGGVINVIDRRIPRREPESPLHADGMLGYGSAANERFANLAVDVPLGSGFILHGDGNWTKSDDLETGGYLLSRPLRDMASGNADPDIRELADLKGKLPNSSAKADEIAGGLAYARNGINAGFSIARHNATYGVPIRFSLVPGAEAEAPTIDMRQTRYDGRVEVPISGLLEAVKLRGGYSRYRHDEIEESGEIGTSFYTRGGEMRAEAVQAQHGGWGGTSGLQYVEKSVRIDGEEKFLPDSRLRQTGLFTLQSMESGPWRVEGGLRFEHSSLHGNADDLLAPPDYARSFNTWSASLGALAEFAPGWKAGLNIARSARAPAIDELFAGGPHAGTQAFEYGDPTLNAEKSVGVEATLRHSSGIVNLSMSAYYSRFTDFIYQAPTGEIEENLPVYRYDQNKARYYGFEAEVDARLPQIFGVDWRIASQADMVRAIITDYGPAPQIPPLRLIGRLQGTRGLLDGSIEIEHALRQSRTAPVETTTQAYTLVNASLEWHPISGSHEVTLRLSADNIFDVVARRHASLLKDYAPLTGRDIRLTARLAY